jgi:pilus assembly protein CpaC
MKASWTLTAAGLTAVALAACIAPARAAEPGAVGAPGGSGLQVVGSDSNSRFVQLGIGKSVVIDLPRDIKDVLVSDPTIANAVIRSSRRAYIIGVKVGQTNVFFFDANGQQIGGLDIAVTRDLNGVRAALKRALPDVYIEGVGDGAVLSGNNPDGSSKSLRYRFAPRRWQ